jgi:excisionase family DNA binding protein
MSRPRTLSSTAATVTPIRQATPAHAPDLAAAAALGDLLAVPALVRELSAEVRALRAELAEVKGRLPPAPLLTIEQAVELTGLSESTIRRRIADGSLPVTRLGRSVRIDAGHLQEPDAREVAALAREAVAANGNGRPGTGGHPG